jgi:hypothetical protein
MAPIDTHSEGQASGTEEKVMKAIALLRVALQFVLVGAALFVVAEFARAQIVDTCVVSGLVKDNSGAILVGAQVDVRNSSTGRESKTITNEDGIYVSPPLSSGDYEVAVSAPGFGTVVQPVRLEVAQRKEIDVVLAPGKTTQVINVKASTLQLDTQNSTLSNLRTATAVKNLPLNSRNFAQLMGLAAGVAPAQSEITGTVALSAVRGSTSYSVNGLRLEENHYLLDGISDNENHNGLGIVLFPPLDAVDEFREETSVPDARYGRGGGGTVNLIFKSGASQFHGDLFEFLRNSDLDARNFFDQNLPGFKMNQFGGTIGGPLGSRKNPKTFFFADYQGTRTRQGLTYVSTVPTAAFRDGDFSAAPQQIYDPSTQVSLPGGGYSRSQFPGNIIPPDRIDMVGQNIMNLYPVPNLPGIANNFLYDPIRWLSEDEFDGRVDRTFSDKDSGFVRYSHARDDIFQPGPLPAPAVGGVISGLSLEPSNQAVLSETHLISPTTVNSVRMGWSRIGINSTDANTGQALATAIGIPGSNVPGDPATDGLPLINITGTQALGSYGNLPAIIVSNNYQWDDDVTLVRGRHTLNIGGEFMRLQYNVFQTANLRGTLNFTTAFSSDPALTSATGLGLADLLLGKPISGSLQFLSGTRGMRQSDIAGYLQDDFKATEKLTLNLGVRYENFLGWPWVEAYTRAYAFTPPSGVAQVGTDGIPASGVHDNPTNFMPRVGVAYHVRPKTVVRAAYGIFYSAPQVPFSLDVTANPPELINTAYTNSQFNFTGATPASAGFSHPSSGTVLGSSLYALQPYTPMPYTQQWNATVQQQLTASTRLTVAYVGTAGTHLQAQANINQPVPGTTPIVERRPFPLFQSITDVENIDTSRYHALQVTAERRVTGNLNFQLAYTYSHTTDYASLDVGSGGALFTDSYNLRLDYGNADYNIPQRFVASTTYLLPFHSSGRLRPLVQGWQANGILSVYSGIPFSVLAATNTLNIGSGSRAELIGPGNGSLPSGERSVQEWFNIAAFSTPPTLQFGDAARNSLQGPPTRQLDFSAFKNFALGEGSPRSLQFRAELFNIFNTPQFNNPGVTIGAPGAGAITSAGSPYTFQRLSREVQLALKLYF